MQVVVTDANILINFFHIQRLALLGELPPMRFLVPAEVINEITHVDQQVAVSNALRQGELISATLTELPATQRYAALRKVMGRGEAACLALASTTGACVASDERKRFRREAIKLLGQDRIVTTQSILLHAIKLSRLTVADADVALQRLARNKFRMSIRSFAELL